jgi:hypothetical protein
MNALLDRIKFGLRPCGSTFPVGMIKRLFSPAVVISVGLAVGACTPFANTVSDYWPTWAGGMPKDVPPRPGAPGYDEFLLHQQGKDVTPPAAPSSDNAGALGAPSAPPSDNANMRAVPPGSPSRNDQAAMQGGLY